MKKLISILLVIACMLVMASCEMGGGEQPPVDNTETQKVLDTLSEQIKKSAPSKSVVETVVGNELISLSSKETVVKGEVSGKEASLWEREYEALNDLGADSAVKKLVTEREEYVEGMGIRTNGGVWEDFPNPIRQIRPYRINLDAALIQGFYAGETDKGSPSYSFVVLNKNIAAVLTGMDADALASITSDVSVVIETDSVNVTRISLTYDMKSVALNGDNKLEDCKATLDAVYSYDLQSITLIDKN
ncbi:MAG: hypothetical protein IJZ24_07180 [Clostridia bacterium]|nr:hypothetical protein [Clostridia bacterium]